MKSQEVDIWHRGQDHREKLNLEFKSTDLFVLSFFLIRCPW
jgi:hypothetical protein